MCSLSVKVLSNYLHLQAHCDKLKAFRIAQFFQNSKIQKITVKKFFFRNSDDGFLLIGVFQVYIRSFKAKLAETKIWIFSESSPTNSYTFFLVMNGSAEKHRFNLRSSVTYCDDARWCMAVIPDDHH